MTFISTIKDMDNNNYNTVKIGNQIWMLENLKTTKYSNGNTIANISDSTLWGTQTLGAFCWYKNDKDKYKGTYGALYNWYAVKTGKLCPSGWHVPTDAEWLTLGDYLGGEEVSGGKLKEVGTIHWRNPNNGATNESGFTALPGGIRYEEGQFLEVGWYAYWWCFRCNK